MIGWLHGQSVGGFQRLIPCQFISVEQLRVAPLLDTPACTPGSSAADACLSTDGIGRAALSLLDHGPALPGRER